MQQYLTLDDLDVTGKRVLVRCDFNVPIHNGMVTDTTRLDRATATIQELIEKGAKVVVMSHLGRPKGPNPNLSLKLIQPLLSDNLWGTPVYFVEDCRGSNVQRALEGLPQGQVLLLENLRFYPQEEANDPEFARQLASLGDLYVNDAFACMHRAHASVEAIVRIMPLHAIGRLVQEEVQALTHALEKPKRPLMGIVGGAKVSTKLRLLSHLIEKTDKLFVGGGMANTLLMAQGVDVGRSMMETDMLDMARDIMAQAAEKKCQLLLPTDAIVAESLDAGDGGERVNVDNIPAHKMIVDIGPATIKCLMVHIKECTSLIWNGPLGVIEVPPFDQGTTEMAHWVAARTQEGHLLSVAGGGDTVAALTHAGALDDFSYVSTAGGAFLEWMEGQCLPGLKALQRAQPEGLHCPLSARV